MRLFAAGFFYLPVYLLAAEKARTPIEATLPQTLLYTLGFASLWVGALLDRSDRKRVLVLSTLGQAALALALLPPQACLFPISSFSFCSLSSWTASAPWVRGFT